MSVLTLIRAKEEDSGTYSMRVDNGDKTYTVRLVLEVKGQRKPVSFCRARSFFPPRVLTPPRTLSQCPQSSWT